MLTLLLFILLTAPTQAGFLPGSPGGVAPPDPPEDYYATNRSELITYLGLVECGQVIELADNNYGDFDFTNSCDGEYITIRAQNQYQAVFDDIVLDSGDSYWKFEGVESLDHIHIENADHLQFVGTKLPGVFFNNSGDFTLIQDSDIYGEAVTIAHAHDITITGTTIRDVVDNDATQIIGDVYNLVFTYNQVLDVTAFEGAHPDLMQVRSESGFVPHDLLIQNNLFWDDYSTGEEAVQGIFISDGGTGYIDVTVDNNLIAATRENGLAIREGIENVNLTNNTITGGALVVFNAGNDNSGTTVTWNIAPYATNEGGGVTYANNYIYAPTPTEDLMPDYVDGQTWQQFVPGDGTPIEFGSGYGAWEYLQELLGG